MLLVKLPYFVFKSVSSQFKLFACYYYFSHTPVLLELCLMLMQHFRELKDNLGSDEPEGDAPLLLQTMLARNPGIFREKSMERKMNEIVI